MKVLIPLLSLFVLFSSCDKSVENPDSAPPENHEEFISANFDGEELYFTNTAGADYYNAYYYTDSINHDQLNLIRDSDDGSKSMQIFALGSRLYEQKFPVSLTDVSLCTVELQLIDLKTDFHCMHCPEDDYHFISMVPPEVIVTDFDNHGYISGNFRGEIATPTGRKMSVENGSFRMKIVDMYNK